MSKCGGLHCPGCGDGGGRVVLLAICAVLLLASGGATALVHTAEAALWAALAVTALTVAAGGAWVVYRARHPALVPWNPSPEGVVRATVVQPAAARELGSERPAIPQHLHLHFDGADPAAVAEILRRSQRPEQ